MSEQRYPFTVTAGNHGRYDAKGNPEAFSPGDTIMMTFAEAEASKSWVKPAPGTPTPPVAGALAGVESEATPAEEPPPPAPGDAEAFGDWVGFLDSHNVGDARAKIEGLKDAEELAAVLAAEENRETPRKGVIAAAEDRLRVLGVEVERASGEGG